MYVYGLDHGELGEQFLVLKNGSPLFIIREMNAYQLYSLIGVYRIR